MDELHYQVDLLSAMNQRLTNDERIYQLIYETSGDAFLYVNLVGNKVKALANWNFFFQNVDIKTSKDLSKLYPYVEDKYVLPLRDLLFPERSKMNRDSGNIRLKNGNRWVECKTAVWYDEEGNATDKVIRFRDISQLKDREEELLQMAYYDVLTGLYNRNYFVKLLSDDICHAEKEGAAVVTMFLSVTEQGIDNAGAELSVEEEVLQKVGQFLESFQGEKVIVSHFEGGNFGIAIYEPGGNKNPEQISKAVYERMAEPFTLRSGQKILLRASVGIAEYPEAARDALKLIGSAEIAMRKAVEKGENVQYFDESLQKELGQNGEIERKLKEAISEQKFEINFQPQYDTKDHEMRGMEALIRWRDQDGKMLSPSVFIPIAEKSGEIVPIGAWVAEEGLRIFSKWKKKFGYKMLLSLNISAVQCMEKGFVDSILGVLQKYDVDPEELELEVTESLFMGDFKKMAEKMRVLKDYGIRICLDGFGNDYSFISSLRCLPIDTLKIDKSLIDVSITDGTAKVIAESIITMAKKLGFETVAVGVETKEQLDYLKEAGCDCIQGYLLGKPMPKEEVEKLLESKAEQ